MPLTAREQIEDRCKHFTGRQHDRCAIEILYTDVEVKGEGIPCIMNRRFTAGYCVNREISTPDEVEAEIKAIDEDGQLFSKAQYRVIKHIKETQETSGEVECPACGGRLKYFRAEVNKHIHAKCSCGFGWHE